MKEIAVAKVDDLQNGQMQQITVNDSQILLAKINVMTNFMPQVLFVPIMAHL
jgi:hypothetical protein